MKKNYNVFSLFILALLFLVSSCNNDNDNPDPADDCVVTQVVEGDNKTEFVYTNEQLTRINFDSAGTTSDSYFTLERNAGGQITKAQQFDASNNSDFYLTYEYNNTGQVVKANIFNKDSGGTFKNNAYFGYEYTNNVLTKFTTYALYLGAAIPAFSTEFTVDAKGNVIQTKEYSLDPTNPFGGLQLVGSTDYLYDDKKNPLKVYSFLLPDAFTLSNNNITSKVLKDKNGATVGTETTAYEYNAQDYPTKQTSNATGSAARVTNLTYTCE